MRLCTKNACVYVHAFVYDHVCITGAYDNGWTTIILFLIKTFPPFS